MKYRRLVALLALAVVALGAVTLFFRPQIYPALSTLRAHFFARDGVRKLEAGQVEEALRKIEAAVQLAPTDPTTLQARMLAFMALRDPRGDETWIALAQQNPTPHNLIEATRASIARRDFERARAFLATLASQPGYGEKEQALRATLAVAEGDIPGAIATLQELFDRGALSPEGLITLTTLLRSQPVLHANSLEKIHPALAILAEQQTEPGLVALLLLASGLPPNDPQRSDLAIRIESHPSAAGVHRIIAAALRDSSSEPGSPLRERILTESAQWAPRETATAAWWLLEQPNGASLVIDLIPRERARTNRELLLVRLQALATAGQWQELEETLSQRPLPLTETEINAGLATAAAHGDHSRDVESLWQRAVLAAGTDGATLIALAARAESLGWKDRARAIYERLTTDPRHSERAFDGLTRLDSTVRVEDALPTLERAAEALPNSIRARANLVYARFLLNRHSAEDLQTAAKLALKNRGVPALHTTLALGFLQNGNAVAALSALEELRIDWRTADPSKAAVYSAVLAANTRVSEAQEILARINLADLRLEERELIREHLPATNTPADEGDSNAGSARKIGAPKRNAKSDKEAP